MTFRTTNLMRKLLDAMLLVALLAYAVGGPDVLLSLRHPVAVKKAEATATYGRETRTAEFLLGGGVDLTARASDVQTYSANDGSWPTTKPSSASADVIKLSGNNIHVIAAQLDVSYDIVGMTAAGAHVTDNRVTLDVQGTAGAGTDVPANDITSAAYDATAPLIGVTTAASDAEYLYDVSGFFNTQHDTDFQNGVGVIMSIATTFKSSASRALTSAKLVLTYDTDAPDGNDPSYALVKTVRLPLDSIAGSDTGSMQSGCAAGSTCGFTFDTTAVPDLASTADILSAHVELGARVNATSPFSMTAQLNTGSVSGSIAESATTGGGQHAFRIFQKLSPADFQSFSGLQSFAVVNDPSSQTLQSLGGEVVLTYRYLTSAPQQAETVRYFAGQGTGSPGTALVSLGSASANIANSNAVVKRAWVRLRVGPSNTSYATTYTLDTQVATGTVRAKNYVFSMGARSGGAPLVIQDLASDISSFATGTSVSISYRSSAAGNPPGCAELLTTFVWDGSVSSALTKTIAFPASQRFVDPGISSTNITRSVPLWFGEEGDKTVLSAYVDSRVEQSVKTGYISSLSTKSFALSGVNYAIVDGSNASWPCSFPSLLPLAPTFFTQGTSFSDQRHSLLIGESVGASNFALFSNSVVVTYTAQPAAPARMERQVRTVEYILGGGTATAAFSSGQTAYVGASWGTTKPAARMVTIAGANIRVVSAYLETSFQLGGSNSGANITSLGLTGDATFSGGNIIDMGLADIIGNATVPVLFGSGSGSTNGFLRQFDVTGLLSRQTSGEWNSGVGVLFGLTFSTSAAAPRELSYAKLVVTYESDMDFNRIGPSDETKTVRFPLLSALSGDNGTRSLACAPGNCDFSYNAVMDDWSGDVNDILSVDYEMTGSVAGAVASNVGLTVSSASSPSPASSGSYAWTETASDFTTMRFAWSPPAVSSGFMPGEQQTLRVASAGATLYGLGGEVVVTYRYNTGVHGARQTETVRYSLGQVLASSGSGTIGAATVDLESPGHKVLSAWLRVRHPYSAGTSLTLSGIAGTSTPVVGNYVFAPASRTVGIPVVYQDISAAFDPDATTTAVSATFAMAPTTNVATYMNAEVLVTYQFDGTQGGAVTKTNEFIATQPSYRATINSPRVRTIPFAFPRGVRSVLSDAFVSTDYVHGSYANGSIYDGTLSSYVAGVKQVLTENGAAKVYMPSEIQQVSESALLGTSGGNPYPSNSLMLANDEDDGERVLGSAELAVTYTEEHATARPSFSQKDYRIFFDDNTQPPTDAWPEGTSTLDLPIDGEMTNATRPMRLGEHVRVRLALGVSTTTLATSTYAFRLEYARKVTSCSAISNWTPVDGASGPSVWRGYASSPVAGSVVSGYALPLATDPGTVAQGGTSALNPAAVQPGEEAEYEWDVEQNGAMPGAAYCFRMTESDGTEFDNYAYFPVLVASPYVGETTDWQWFQDNGNESTMPPLAALSETPLTVEANQTLDLRVGVQEVAGVADSNLRFGLQYSPSANFYDGGASVDATSTCTATSTFCYAPSAVGADDGPLAVSYIAGASLGRHNWTTASSTFSPGANSYYEMEYSLKAVHPQTGQVYYFRLVDLNDGVPLDTNGTHTSPSLAESATLGVTISGTSTGAVISGNTMSASSSDTVLPFGNIPLGTSAFLGQNVNVVTNAFEGYTLGMLAGSDLQDSDGDIIPEISATNSAPLPWASACALGSLGCAGYHTTASLLSNGSTRFAATDTWSGLATTTADEIGFSDMPTDNAGQDTQVVYRVEPHAGAMPGEYGADITYIVTPVY